LCRGVTEADAFSPRHRQKFADVRHWYSAQLRHHAPNAKGNFCFEVTLGYRRLERGR
jgi:hypothetical protein